MFGFFRNRKRERVIASIATFLNTSLWRLRPGNLPEKLSSDKFALGYMWGLTASGAYVSGLSSAKDTGLVLIGVFDLLFPGKGLDISNKCTDWSNKKDRIFLKAAQTGVEESSVLYKAMIAGNEDAVKEAVGCFKTFEKHINEKYT